MKKSILIVDDDQATRLGFSRYLAKEGYDVGDASCLAEAKEAIASRRYDALILDQKLPDGKGIEWVPELRSAYQDIAIVMITGAGDIPMAVEAIKRGADNFLAKPVNMPDLSVFLRKSLELGLLRRRDLTRQRLTKTTLPFFGDSDAMKKVLEFASVAGESDSAVLLLGETGSGKGVLARWIHEHSGRASGAFVEINCSVLRGELLASELFGHVKGAFTSAVQDHVGLIEVANRGTLFLDEIGDMDPSVQTQFLHVIEEKHFRRLGDTKNRMSDFRLLCATNKDLLTEGKAGKFRQDLYYRIQTFPIELPPLRERMEDLHGLIRHFLSRHHGSCLEVTPEVMALLETYQWPGNVRELRNILERAALLARGKPLRPEHFPGLSTDGRRPNEPRPANKDLRRLEAEYIKSTIEHNGGDINKTAEELAISRATLYRKLKKSRGASSPPRSS